MSGEFVSTFVAAPPRPVTVPEPPSEAPSAASTALVPVTQKDFAVIIPPWPRELMLCSGAAMAALLGVGATSVLTTSPEATVVAGLVAAFSVGVAVARAFFRGREAKAVRLVEAEYRAVERHRWTLEQRLEKLEAERGKLAEERRGVRDEALQLLEQRSERDRAASQAAATSMTSMHRALSTARANLRAEAAKLSARQRLRIAAAADDYSKRNKWNASLNNCFVAEPYSGSGPSTVFERALAGRQVLEKLLRRGVIYVGNRSPARDSGDVVSARDAKKITTIRQLCELLHARTGQDVPGPP